MKMIVAIIRPEKVQCVKEALSAIGVNGVTIVQVKGRGSQAGLKFTNRIGSFVVDEIEKTMLEIVIDDEKKQDVIDAVKDAASTGHIGDGRIFVLPVEESIKVHDD
ncbi:MAG: P-II family nitrogen regulator [Candidatus Methanoplasma sp.]|jgi:nitrogen regulatory protein P-II 1|nr:P-II family nitrogen regulator [Candidatus Methanoplasma sp.]